MIVMIITYYGAEFFKIQLGDIVIAFNPLSKDSKLAGKKVTKFKADIAMSTLNSKDFNGIDNLSYGDKDPIVIDGPGEYEVKDIFIKGLATESRIKSENGKDLNKTNTIYTLLLDGIRICFLGALGLKEIDSETKEAIDGVDLLFLPIGGGDVLSPAEAYKIYVKLSPKIVIPMHFDDKNLKQFLKEGGLEKIKAVDKLTLKKKDFEDKVGEIMVLKSSI